MLAFVLVLGVAPAAWSVVQPYADVGPPDPAYTYMQVKSGKSGVPASSGTYCLPTKANPTVTTCHTATYPLPGVKRITVKRGATVKLILHAPAGYITWRAARVSAGKERVSVTGEAKVASSTKRSWTVTLPKKLSTKATILGFNVTYLNAYNTYEVGIKVR